MSQQAASSAFLASFTGKLKARNFLPQNIEVSNIGSTVLANVFNQTDESVISEFIFTGMDTDPATAVLKGLVEMTERNAYSQGYKNGLKSCQTERSDGFAAFPRGIVQDSNYQARRNAFHEAVERYVWATWWDQHDIKHKIESVDARRMSSLSENLFLEIAKNVSLKKVLEVEPSVELQAGLSTRIFFAFLEPYGVISGGACGPSTETGATDYRALCEMYRHAVAVSRMKSFGATPISFYEKRLAYFGLSEIGTQLAEERIMVNGSKTIFLPRLSIDEPVPHSLDDLVSVHRCYFENQPPFVGGALERLCL